MTLLRNNLVMGKASMKRLFILMLLLALASSFAFASGAKEKFPSKPLTIISPWSAGGSTDLTARFIASKLAKIVGQPVNVVDRTGGGGAVGMGAGARAKPDGYTIAAVTFEVNTVKYLGYSKLVPSDFIPLVETNQDPAAVIVSANSPYQNVQELLTAIRTQPADTFSFSGSAIGSVWDLARIGMLHKAGIDPKRVKYIPSEGSAPAITQLLGGHITAITSMLAEAGPQIKAGKLKALAVMSDSRNPDFPNVPTLKQQGLNWTYATWRGYAVPLDTPKARVEYLTNALLKIVNSQAFKDFCHKAGYGIHIRSGNNFMNFMMAQYNGLGEIMKLAGYGKNN